MDVVENSLSLESNAYTKCYLVSMDKHVLIQINDVANKYLSCVPSVDGKIHPEGVVQHRG